MTYSYTRHTFKPDGTKHVETINVSSDWLIQRTGRDNRAVLLELVNKWNRQSVASGADAPRYVYTVEN